MAEVARCGPCARGHESGDGCALGRGVRYLETARRRRGDCQAEHWHRVVGDQSAVVKCQAAGVPAAAVAARTRLPAPPRERVQHRSRRGENERLLSGRGRELLPPVGCDGTMHAPACDGQAWDSATRRPAQSRTRRTATSTSGAAPQTRGARVGKIPGQSHGWGRFSRFAALCTAVRASNAGPSAAGYSS